jgi:hypothetical protein
MPNPLHLKVVCLQYTVTVVSTVFGIRLRHICDNVKIALR